MSASALRSATLTGLLGCLYLGSAFALSLADLTNRDASQGIKGALNQGAASAIAKLGVQERMQQPQGQDPVAAGTR